MNDERPTTSPARAPGPVEPWSTLPVETEQLDLPSAERSAEVRLVVVDMDGTLLDADHEVGPGFWPVADELERRGITLCAASGRQLATLERTFGERAPRMVLIAENGAHAVSHGAPLHLATLDLPTVRRAVVAMRAVAANGVRLGVVVCGRRTAYVESDDPEFRAEAGRYYARLERVDDLLAVDDEVFKVAVHDPGSVTRTAYPALRALGDAQAVVLSGAHWTDMMSLGTDKGVALRKAQDLLGVTADQTAAFGDHLNDLEMLGAAGMSFAMAEAHPQVREAAEHLAPSHRHDGVARVLVGMLRSVDHRPTDPRAG